MSDNNNYFTPDDDDEDFGFIDFEDDYPADDDDYTDERPSSGSRRFNTYDDDNDSNNNSHHSGATLFNTYDDDDDYDDDDEPVDSSKDYQSSKGFFSFLFSEVLSLVKIVVIAVVFALVFTNFIIINAEVPSGSMRDTIWEGDRLFGFRLAYKFSEPKRGDIIIFKFPDDETQNYVKRVIGLPNDIVQIKNGRVYINGEELDEPYIKDYILDDGETYTYIVPEDSYFMLGDNRNNSKDSRYWVNTFVKKEKIVAKVVVRYYSGEKSKIDFSLVK
ncbi:signal peptidase I [Eubacterium sp. CAG:252]|nr:signal peptidase I [Eubacterium sp. CAG:252]